jgi:hypothetical protein
MASSKNSQRLTFGSPELEALEFSQAVEKTKLALHNLRRELDARQSRAAEKRRLPQTLLLHPDVEQEPKRESIDDLERELREYFGQGTSGSPEQPTGSQQESPAFSERADSANFLDSTRQKVIEGVVDHILEEWSQRDGGLGPLQDQITERLIQRLLERLRSK